MSKEASSGIEAKGELLCMIDSSEMVGGMGNRFFTRHVTLDRQGSSLRLDKYIVYLIALDHDTVVLFLQGVFGRSEERLPVLDRKSTRLNSSHPLSSRMPSSA